MDENMKKRGVSLLFVFIILLVLSPFIKAENIVEIPNPEIYVSFFGEDVVEILNFGLFNSSGSSFPVSEVLSDRTFDSRTQMHFFHFKPGVVDNPNDPSNFLKNGNYFFIINATDGTGNIDYNQQQEFTVLVPALDIQIVNPRHAVSSLPIFNVSIRTGRQGNVSNSSDCRYNFNADRTWSNMVRYFTSTDSTSSNHITTEEISETGIMYIRCKDIYENTYLQIFNIGVDTTAPVISELVAVPNPIVEEIQSNLQTEISATADEKVICKFDNQSVSYQDMNYNFTNYDPYDENSFNFRKTVLVKFLEDNITYTRYVACENLAGLVSDTSLVTFNTNLDAPLTISIISPPSGAVNASNFVELKVHTNKHTYCNITDDTNTETLFDNVYSNDHEKTLAFTSEGSYSYIIRCSYYQQVAEQGFSYIFDLSKPEMNYVNASEPSLWENPGKTYRTDSIYGRWLAHDEISGIDYYLVQVKEYSGGKCNGAVIMNWTRTTEESVRFSRFDYGDDGYEYELIDGHQYCLNVKAVDFAGHESNELSSNPLTVDVSLQPLEDVAPLTWLNQSLGKGNVKVTIGCLDTGYDISGCDNTSYKYGLSINAESCFPTMNYNGSITVNHTSFFCWEVYDFAQNMAYDYEEIIVEELSQCEDGKLGLDETDVDCGGVCPNKCSNNMLCFYDSDCKSSFCYKGFCKEPTCNDSIKNKFETDIDCGGSTCSKCEVGYNCSKNSDCLSFSCFENSCVMANCTDGVKNGGESDVDCGIGCDKCADGYFCTNNNDCESEYCNEFGKCDKKLIASVDTRPIDEEKSFAWIYIIIGMMILFAGGIGYFLYLKNKKKNMVQSPSPILQQTPQQRVMRPVIDYQKLLAQRKKKRMEELAKKLAEDKRLKKNKKRKGFFETFGEDEEDEDEQPKVVSKIPFSKDKLTNRYSVFDKLSKYLKNEKSSFESLDEMGKESFNKLEGFLDQKRSSTFNDLDSLTGKKKVKEKTFDKLSKIVEKK